jgi:hypothetical protein
MKHMNNYYVYAHQKETDGKCFYIGKGSGKRAWTKQARNQYWKNVVNKHGYKVIILVNNISEIKALELEQSFISQVGLNKLTNLTTGGEGYSHSEETKLKLSQATKGKSKPPRTEEFKQKIANGMKGKTWKCKPYTHSKKRVLSEEHKAKISASLQAYQAKKTQES